MYCFEVPQLQSSINAVFYKQRSTVLPDNCVFEASMYSEENQKNEWVIIPSKQDAVKDEKVALPFLIAQENHYIFSSKHFQILNGRPKNGAHCPDSFSSHNFYSIVVILP